MSKDPWVKLSYDLRAHELVQELLTERCKKHFVGRECRLKAGPYKGRMAEVTDVCIWNGVLHLQARPWRLGGSGNRLLNNANTRLLWKVGDLEFTS